MLLQSQMLARLRATVEVATAHQVIIRSLARVKASDIVASPTQCGDSSTMFHSHPVDRPTERLVRFVLHINFVHRFTLIAHSDFVAS